MTPTNNSCDVVTRALAAYYKSGAIDQPDNALSGVVEHDGKQYVRLLNVNGVLRIYRVRPNGSLKGLRRWPSALNDLTNTQENDA